MTLHTVLSDAGQVVALVTSVAALWHTLTHNHRGGGQ